MIDYENEILTAIQDGLESAGLSKVDMFDELILAPSKFPCVCVEEIDNYTETSTVDSGSNENHAIVAYEINVYSNSTRDKRRECKDIFAVVSDVLTHKGFMRLSANPINFNSATAYRLTGRFRAVISKEGQIYSNRR